MQVLTLGDIQVDSVIPVRDIREFHMEIRGNSHIYVQIEGMVSDEEGEDCLLQPIAGTGFTVRADHQILFAGMLKEAQIKQEGRGYQVSLTGVSDTERLDYRKKRRTFQDTSMTYREVMQTVLADTPGAKLQFHVEDREIGMPLYQIEETDWAFLKRLAGRLQTGIVVCAFTPVPDIHIGIPKGGEQKADDKIMRERVWYDREHKTFCQRVRTGEHWEIGDAVDCEEGRFTVTEKECRLEQGLLYFHDILAKQAFIKADTGENTYATGTLLAATVLEVQGEEIRVKFDVDKEQPVESAYWYPWEPDMGNLTYCMPEKGERVYVRIGDAFGREGRAVCGVHRNGEGNPEMEVSNRYFTTKDQKRMYLMPDTIGFQDRKQKKTLRAELRDDTGASFTSHGQLTITAEEQVGLIANKILFQAPQEISLVKKAVQPAVLNMCNGFDLIGAADAVKMNGSKEEAFPVFSREETAKYVFKEPKKVEACLIGSTPAAGLEGSLGVKLESCLVKQLGRGYLA